MTGKAQYIVETTGSISVVRMINSGGYPIARFDTPSNQRDAEFEELKPSPPPEDDPREC